MTLPIVASTPLDGPALSKAACGSLRFARTAAGKSRQLECHDNQSHDNADDEKKTFVVAHGIHKGAAGPFDFRVGGQKGQAHDQPENQHGQYQCLGVHPLVSPDGVIVDGGVL
jgi:hypothetical protein